MSQGEHSRGFAPGQRLGRRSPDGVRRPEDRQRRQRPRGGRGVDLPQEPDRHRLVLGASRPEDLCDRWHGEGVGHALERRLRLGPPGRLAEPGLPLRQEGAPAGVGLATGVGLGLLGGQLVGGDPAAPLLAGAELLPGLLAGGVEPDDGEEMGPGLVEQPGLLAPLGHLPVGLRRVGDLLAAEVVAGEGVGPIGQPPGPGDGLRGGPPLAAVVHPAEESPGERVVGLDLDREPEVLPLEDRESPGLAPEGQADVGIGVTPRRGLGGPINRVVWRVVRPDQGDDEAEDQALDHPNVSPESPSGSRAMIRIVSPMQSSGKDDV